MRGSLEKARPFVIAAACLGMQTEVEYRFEVSEPSERAIRSQVHGRPPDSMDPTLAIQEGERQRIASELHDGLGQKLSLLLLDLCNAKQAVLASAADPAVNACLERASTGAREAIDELRNSIMALYPSMLSDLGLVASLSWILRGISEAQPNLQVESDLGIKETDVPRSLHITVFRIVQEAVNNALKHAGAGKLKVLLRGGTPAVTLTIVDDGRGFHAPLYANHRHSGGVSGMLRRAQASGGDFRIVTGPGAGTRITVTWPMERVS